MNRSIYLLLVLTFLITKPALFAQIGMGGQPHSSAVLDLKSPANDKAFYPPRLSSAQRLAIPNPQAGAFVYDYERGTMFLYDGQNWLPLLTTDASLLSPISRTANDGVVADQFGYSVAISGDYAIVGAYGKTYSQGAAYVFVRSGSSWTQQQRLMASDGVGSDLFGCSVAISGDYAIIGAYSKEVGSNYSQGAVYMFTRSGSTWTQQQRLIARDGAGSDHFGRCVALSGEYAIVGANNKTIGDNVGQGAAYVFVRSGSTWTQLQRFTATDGVAGDNFGSSVAISGNNIIVGADAKDIGNNFSQGAAYAFIRNGSSWTQQRLTASDGAAFDGFGNSVAISGNDVIIGADIKDIGSNEQQGAAYVFVRSGSTWTQQRRLIASDGAGRDHFGCSVAISGDYIIVGASGKTIGNNESQGTAYVFVRSGSTWSQQQRVTDNSPAETLNGTSVGLSNGTYIIGGQGFQNYRGKVGFGIVN